MDKQFYNTLHKGRDYLSMLELKLNHAIKRAYLELIPRP